MKLKNLYDLTKAELIGELKARDKLIQKLLKTNEDLEIFINLTREE